MIGRARSTAAALVAVAVLGASPPAAAHGPTEQWVVKRVTGGVDVIEADRATAAALAAQPGVAWVALDVEYRIAEEPDDPLFPSQSEHSQIDTPEAWDITDGVSGTVVAVLDTGVDADHPDLHGALGDGTDVVNGDGDPDDDHGHGTAVTGVLAARTGNGTGIAGVCGLCTVLPVKVLDENGVGTASDIAAGIAWATDHGAEIINLSIAGPEPHPLVTEQIDRAVNHDVVVVASAGNEGSTRPTYPAANSGVIAVAGVDQTDNIYVWSNRGPWVDLAAPGCPQATAPGGTFGVICGTSFSAPMVSGVAALARTADHLATAGEVKDALAAAAVPVGSGVEHGRIDADDTLFALSPGIGQAAGSGRAATAVQISQHAFPFGADTVMIATQLAYADALAAAGLAGQREAPILLTDPLELSAVTADEVARLGATTAVIVGGSSAVSTEVEADLMAAGVDTVERFFGDDRFGTAAAVTAEIVSASGAEDVAVFVTEGINPDPSRGWPDAVAVSSLAAFLRRGVLLVHHDHAPDATLDALTDLGVIEATIVGGVAAVDATVENAVSDPDGDGSDDVAVDRIAGDTRYHTSALVADAAVDAGASPDSVWFATGTFWADALAAGPAGGILLLVKGATVPTDEADNWLAAHHSSLEWLRIAGGPAAVNPAAAQHLDEVVSG